MASLDAEVPRASNWNLPNLITVVRILLAPLFFWMLLVDNGADGALRWWAAIVFIVAIATDGVDGCDRSPPGPRHRPRQDPRPDRRQAAHGRRPRLPVDPGRAAVVGDHHHPRARGRHHRLAHGRALASQRRSGIPRRQAQDHRAVHRHLARPRSRCGPCSATGSSGSMGRDGECFALTVWSGIEYLRSAWKLKRALPTTPAGAAPGPPSGTDA